MKPVLFVTGHAPAYRVGAFALLAEREQVEFALFGGRLKHGGPPAGALTSPAGTPIPPAGTDGPETDTHAFPHSAVREQDLYALAASGRYRAVVCSTAGRIALPATWAGARRARVPLLLWASLWAHPRSAVHAASYLALRRLYASADAVVTYGPHVSRYVREFGARNVHEAPQAVDNDFWSAPDVQPIARPDWPNQIDMKFMFAGRPAREKGLGVLFEAWSMSGLQAPTAALVLVGRGSTPPWVPAGGAVVGGQPGGVGGETPDVDGQTRGERTSGRASSHGPVVSIEPVAAPTLRDLYAAVDALVVPSIATRTFREPWGLVVNEAMNRALPVIASDAVGAAAGGLVRDGRNGLVVPAGDAVALAIALRRLAFDRPLRERLGAAGRTDVAAYGYAAWAEGFSRALASVGVSGEGVR
ncbi:MAG TPA: glycosyltransferase family 4 protein [Solirubrobacteraceae bacterium]|jgi:glycosyltransferase involved in cell wall biosynthesis|nr:glycosyltransferase family 4 protein [Solirubrobacteraceae bacterium]